MWLQQYKAMFLKRWYNFKRFLPALIWQLLLPLVFVILGLVLAAVIPASHDEDPLRKMSLDSSAPSETRTIFWSQHSSANLSSIPFTMQVKPNIHDMIWSHRCIIATCVLQNCTVICHIRHVLYHGKP